jgi:hypothetical protein
MLDKDAIDHANEVRNDPVLRLPETREATLRACALSASPTIDHYK